MKKLTKKTRKEIAAYVRNNVEDYGLYLQLALKRMERMRCPFSMAADEGFYCDIQNAVEDWCINNDIDDVDDFIEDWEDFLEGDEGIIWEE